MRKKETRSQSGPCGGSSESQISSQWGQEECRTECKSQPLPRHFSSPFIVISSLLNVPHVLRPVTKLTTCHTRAQRVVTHTNLLINPSICKIILSLRHCAHYHANALPIAQALYILPHIRDGSLPAQRHLSAIWRQVLQYRVLYNPEQLLARRGRADAQLMQQLHHQTRESLERAWDAHSWVDLDENALRRLDVDLELASFVDWGVEES